MKLYSYWRSSSSWRVRIGLHYKQLPFEYVGVHLLKDGGEQSQVAHMRRNPMGEVPVLKLEDGTHLSQSIAILEYLEEVHPTPPLLPRDWIARAHTRALVEIINSGTQPFQNLAVLTRVKQLGGDSTAWARDFITRSLAALESHTHSLSGRYLIGDEITLADACLVPQLYSARRFGVDLSAVPTLLRIESMLVQHPAFIAAAAEQQPDAEK